MEDDSLARAIWDNAPDGMLVVDDRGRILRVNPAALDLFGYGEGELVGQPIEMLVPVRFRDGHAGKRNGHDSQQRRMMGAPLSSLVAQHKDGGELPVEIALSPLVFNDRRATIAIVRDVRQRRQLEEQLRFSSTHDSLTGLYNRAYLDQELLRLARGRRFPVAVIVIDIDGLKPVNDAGGHAAGDDLLVRAARLFSSAARGDDVVARVGGDEFVIVLPQTTQQTAEQVVARMAQAAQSQATDEGCPPPVRYSAGIAVAEDPGSLQRALREADDRMYVDKRSRRVARR